MRLTKLTHVLTNRLGDSRYGSSTLADVFAIARALREWSPANFQHQSRRELNGAFKRSTHPDAYTPLLSPQAAMSELGGHKRKRMSGSVDEPCTFSAFFKDPQADVVLRSTDKISFATRRLFLIAASSAFEGMFDVPQPTAVELSAKTDTPWGALSVVEMSETAEELEPFLRWIHRDTFEALHDEIAASDGSFDDPIIRQLAHILHCARKYDCPAVFNLAWTLVMEKTDGYPEDALALGVIYRRRGIVERSMDRWMRSGEILQAVAMLRIIHQGSLCRFAYPREREETIERLLKICKEQPCSIADVSSLFLVRLPPGFFLHITIAENSMRYSREHDAGRSIDLFMKAFDEEFPLPCKFVYGF